MGTVFVFAEKKGNQGYYGTLPVSGKKMEIFPLAGTRAVGADEDVDLAIIDCGADADAGLCLLREIKHDRADVPIIFITDMSTEEVVYKAFKYGAREYFKKPLDRVEFTETVEKLLRFRRDGSGERPLPAGTQDGDMPATIRLPDTLPDRFLRVIDYMEQNLAAPLYLDELARQACLSKYHFCRMFKKHLGVSPIQFILGLRVRQAAKLLRGAAVTISNVALRTGFSDLSEFNKQFKRVTGLTPSAYRKSP